MVIQNLNPWSDNFRTSGRIQPKYATSRRIRLKGFERRGKAGNMPRHPFTVGSVGRGSNNGGWLRRGRRAPEQSFMAKKKRAKRSVPGGSGAGNRWRVLHRVPGPVARAGDRPVEEPKAKQWRGPRTGPAPRSRPARTQESDGWVASATARRLRVRVRRTAGRPGRKTRAGWAHPRPSHPSRVLRMPPCRPMGPLGGHRPAED